VGLCRGWVGNKRKLMGTKDFEGAIGGNNRDLIGTV